MNNFDPAALLAKVEDVVKTVEGIETKVESLASFVGPVLHIFAPFLPKNMQNASDEIPVYVAEIQKVKSFVNELLPLVEELVGAAGKGATADANAVNPEFATQTVDATSVGEFTKPPLPAGADHIEHDGTVVPKAGMKYEMIDGKLTLVEVP